MLHQHSNIAITKSQIKRRRILFKAILVGLVAGLIACSFRWALVLAESGRNRFFHYIISQEIAPFWQFLICILVCTVGAGGSVWLVKRFAPEAAGSGIPYLKAVILGEKKFRWCRLIPIKFLAGVLGIGSGLALGREGPTVQMGGAAGMLVSDALQLKQESTERTVLISAGAAAGLSAAFNAPLAALMFVLEELYGTLTPVIFVASFLAAVTADIVTQMLLGSQPVFSLNTIPTPTLAAIPVAIVLGLFCGFIGIAFNKSLLISLDMFEKLKKYPPFLIGGAVGLCAGVVFWFSPDTVGSGGMLTEHALKNDVAINGLLGLILIRFLLTIVSYGLGAAGGIFTPILVIGALLGLMIGHLAKMAIPELAATPEIFAVIGMGTLFTAIVRAPLTGIVLMIELTGKYDFMLPLLVCSLTSYGIAEYFKVPPIYEALRKRSQ